MTSQGESANCPRAWYLVGSKGDKSCNERWSGCGLERIKASSPGLRRRECKRECESVLFGHHGDGTGRIVCGPCSVWSQWIDGSMRRRLVNSRMDALCWKANSASRQWPWHKKVMRPPLTRTRQNFVSLGTARADAAVPPRPAAPQGCARGEFAGSGSRALQNGRSTTPMLPWEVLSTRCLPVTQAARHDQPSLAVAVRKAEPNLSSVPWIAAEAERT